MAFERCYNKTLKEPFRKESFSVRVESQDEKTLQEGELVDEMEEILINELGRKVKIGSQLAQETREKLISFLQDNGDVFAWTHEDMPGIYPSVIVY